jgi:mannose-1-phosphate guanylyltransferase/mannose-6-phosphate isomerase
LALPHRDLNESLLQQTIHRILSINHKGIRLDNPLIVTNEDHRFLVVDQLFELSSSIQNLAATLVLEPSGKNTAPALTLAALCAQEDGSDPILVVSPADQIIGDLAAFQKALKNQRQEHNY